MTRLLFTLLAAVAVSIGVAGCGNSGPDRSAYVKQNDALFHQLPVYPGAKIGGEITTSWGKNDGETILGYSTRYVFALPRAVRAEQVEKFYRQRLAEPKWHLNTRLEGPVLNYVSGHAQVSINLGNAPIHKMEIAVDHDHRT